MQFVLACVQAVNQTLVWTKWQDQDQQVSYIAIPVIRGVKAPLRAALGDFGGVWTHQI